MPVHRPQRVIRVCASECDSTAEIVRALCGSECGGIRLTTHRWRSLHLIGGAFRTDNGWHRCCRSIVHLRPQSGRGEHQQSYADSLKQFHDYGTTMVSRGRSLMFWAGFWPLTTSL